MKEILSIENWKFGSKSMSDGWFVKSVIMREASAKTRSPQ